MQNITPDLASSLFQTEVFVSFKNFQFTSSAGM